MNLSDPQNLSRRDVLFGQGKSASLKEQELENHLPWATGKAIDDFCTGCGDCVSACPEEVIILTEKGHATVDFSKGECVFCQECADICPEPVFATKSDRDQVPPWVGQPEISKSCLAIQGVVCQVCKDQCPENIIKFPPTLGAVAQPDINTQSCTACGACVSSCPTAAIQIKFERSA